MSNAVVSLTPVTTPTTRPIETETPENTQTDNKSNESTVAGGSSTSSSDGEGGGNHDRPPPAPKSSLADEGLRKPGEQFVPSSSSSSSSASSESGSSSSSMAGAQSQQSASTSQQQTIPQQQQQTSPVHVQMVPLVGPTVGNQTSLQYFQYPNGVVTSGTPHNASPISSSLTSSPSATSNNTPTSAGPVQFSTTHHSHPAIAHQHAHVHPHLNSINLAAAVAQAQQTQQQQTVHHHMHHPQQFHAFNPNFKDTRWLTLEVCREFQRAKCQRTDAECKFAHPPAHVEVTNGKVIACYDSLKGKCTRKEPPCKYLHPPQHLKDQLLQNGKNNLVLRQVALAMMQQQHQAAAQQQVAVAQGQATPTGGHHHHHHHHQQSAAASNVTAALLNGAHHHPHHHNGATGTPTNMVQASPAAAAQFLFNGANSFNGLGPGAANANPNPSAQLIPASALAQAGLAQAFPQIQLTQGGQATLFPMIGSNAGSSNGYHHPHHSHHAANPGAGLPPHLVGHPHAHQHHSSLHQIQSGGGAPATTFLTDHTGLIHQVSNASLLAAAAAAAAANGASPGAVAATANGLLAPQQRTDRLPICKDYQAGTCQKPASECQHAHPPSHCPIDSENSLVTVCVDFVKGKCSRDTCKYFHPPEHLVAQLKKQKINNSALVAAAAKAQVAQQQQAAVMAALNFLPLQAGPNTAPQLIAFNPAGAQPTQLVYRPMNVHAQTFQRAPGASYYGANSGLVLNRQQIQLASPVGPVDLVLGRNGASSTGSTSSSSSSSSTTSTQASSSSSSSSAPTAAAVASASTTSSTPSSGNTTATAAAPSNLQGNELTDAQTSANFTATLENGQSFQIPQFQIYAPIYQRPGAASAGPSNSVDELNASASATTANAAAANVVDVVVQGKKRPHDAIEQDFIPLTSANVYQGGTGSGSTSSGGNSAGANGPNGVNSNLSVKRTALADAKTGMPVFHPPQPALHQLHPAAAAQHLALAAAAAQQAPLTALNYPINFPMQYTPYISLPYTGHPSGMPRL